MAESYPRRDQARGIWKIGDITKNIKGDGTYPQLSLGDRMLVLGGLGLVDTIESIEISTAGNSVDFGNLVTATADGGACSSATRTVFGGGQTPSNVNTCLALNKKILLLYKINN